MFEGFFGGILRYIISLAILIGGIWWALGQPSWEDIIGKKQEKKIGKKRSNKKKTNKSKKRNKKAKKNRND